LLIRQPARLSLTHLLLLLLLLLSTFSLFQFSITTVQSQTCECNARTQNLPEKTPWNTSEVAERAWRGRRRHPARAASLALNMKVTFPMRSQPMELAPLRTCPEKTVLILAVLWVLFQQIFMFSIDHLFIYPILKQPRLEAQFEFAFH
jgi:hypothetical protein